MKRAHDSESISHMKSKIEPLKQIKAENRCVAFFGSPCIINQNVFNLNSQLLPDVRSLILCFCKHMICLWCEFICTFLVYWNLRKFPSAEQPWIYAQGEAEVGKAATCKKIGKSRGEPDTMGGSAWQNPCLTGLLKLLLLLGAAATFRKPSFPESGKTSARTERVGHLPARFFWVLLVITLALQIRQQLNTGKRLYGKYLYWFFLHNSEQLCIWNWPGSPSPCTMSVIIFPPRFISLCGWARPYLF